MDLLALPRGTEAFQTALTYMTLNLVVFVLFVVNMVIPDAADPTVKTLRVVRT